jgi:arylsulfatase
MMAREHRRPDIVFVPWDSVGWGEVGCHGGGIPRGAPMPKIGALAEQGSRLLKFNVEAWRIPG